MRSQFRPRSRQELEPHALDPAWEADQRRDAWQRMSERQKARAMFRGDDFDNFLRKQRRRIHGKLQRTEQRMQTWNENGVAEHFEHKTGVK